MNKQDVRELVFKQLQSGRAKESFEKMQSERVKALDEFKIGLSVMKGIKSGLGKPEDNRASIYGESPTVAMIDEKGK